MEVNYRGFLNNHFPDLDELNRKLNFPPENELSIILSILNFMPNRFGGYDHQIVIYYIENLQRLIETERKEKEARELQRAKTGQKAF